MKFNEFDVVKLKNDDLEFGVKKSYLGTIVDVQKGTYCVEFLDDNNNTIEKALDKYYSPDELVKVN
ncbi:DUF4926 domain-containing protein [Erysipelothrix sp. HDW6A]|uniref:DUF4926 domain-containing protein n=1 Tax=Erysipelothrix sp. HDW6A TaxID=2714928 RepID=UPI00140C18C7|nr:DUF4926 domain-containing protein [Erysipelothrix sp. HDW6A]QIK57775.1 DUF4926 domain-containing protein [Erysipelothrix sp. HDW6A]